MELVCAAGVANETTRVSHAQYYWAVLSYPQYALEHIEHEFGRHFAEENLLSMQFQFLNLCS